MRGEAGSREIFRGKFTCDQIPPSPPRQFFIAQTCLPAKALATAGVVFREKALNPYVNKKPTIIVG